MLQREWRITRQELYQAMWEKPLKQLAQEYNVWYGELLRISDEYQVPRPPMGYWTKKQHGKAPTSTPLKPLEGKEEIVVQLYVHEPNPVDQEQKSKADKLIAAEALPLNQIHVEQELTHPHPLVKRAEKYLTDGKPNEKGILEGINRTHLDIRVSAGTLERALGIMNALVRALEKRKLRVEVVGEYECFSRVEVLGETFLFGIEEVLEREPIPLSPEEKHKRYLSLETPVQPFKYTPTGRLVLKIKNREGSHIRKSWGDGKKQRLEDLLNQFIIGLYEAAVVVRGERAKREEQQKRLEEMRRQREEDEWQERQRQWKLREEREKEEKRIKELLDEVERWEKSRKIRGYLDAVRAHHAVNGRVPEEIEEWLTWANQVADGFDPRTSEPRPNVEEKKGLR